jgi:hypothetical protein
MQSKQTPWGTALTTEKLGDGILWVETSTNGGILIETNLASSLLSARVLKLGQSWQNCLAFEHGNGLLAIFYEHPELYPWIEPELTEKISADCLHVEYPEYFYC